jgi:bacteriocin-like protein
MAKDADKSPKPETAKSQKIERDDTAPPHDNELTDEQLRKISGGGGPPTSVVD